MKKYSVEYQKEGDNKTSVVTKDELETFIFNKNIIQIKEHQTYFNRYTMKHIKKSEMLELFNQLDMILQANITLYDALNIIVKGIKNKHLQELIVSMMSALKGGKPIYESFFGYEKYLDETIISFFKISNMKGNTSLIVSSLCKVLNLKKTNKALIISSLSYPLLILVSFFMALGIIFVLVIPKFEHIFIQYNLELPLYTVYLLALKELLTQYYLVIISLIMLIVFYIKMRYKNSKFRYKFDELLIQKIPLVSTLYSLFEFYNLFICMNVLLKSKYTFSVSLENSALLLKNKYLLDKIQMINRNIKNGCSIYDSFEKVKLFDEVVLNLLNSGEKSSKMEDALQRIEEYYQQKFTKRIKRFASLIEPLFFAVMMLLILWVMLAIFTPIWNMSEMLNL